MRYTKDEIRQGMRLYAVTDRAWAGEGGLLRQVEEALVGGATFLQLREKELDNDAFMQEAKELKKLAARYRVPFVINDGVEIALEMDADGVHVGQDDMSAAEARQLLGQDKIIGVSVGTVEEAKAAEAASADYLGVGAVFATATKEDAKAMPMAVLQEICKSVSIPVVAIGGIALENMDKLSGSGIDGVAVVSAIFGAKDIVVATKALLDKTKTVIPE